jgi:hypothetical protein
VVPVRPGVTVAVATVFDVDEPGSVTVAVPRVTLAPAPDFCLALAADLPFFVFAALALTVGRWMWNVMPGLLSGEEVDGVVATFGDPPEQAATTTASAPTPAQPRNRRPPERGMGAAYVKRRPCATELPPLPRT